jgi:hypothetical protein
MTRALDLFACGVAILHHQPLVIIESGTDFFEDLIVHLGGKEWLAGCSFPLSF